MNKNSDLLEHISKNGKDKSWLEFSTQYGFKNSECARKYWQRNKKSYINSSVTKVKEWEVQGKNGEVKSLKSFEYKVSTPESDYKEAFLEFLKESTASLTEKSFQRENKGVSLLISLSDLHIDKLTVVEEVKEKGSINGQMSRAIDAVYDIIERARLVHPIKKIVLIGGNDFFHANSSQNTTVKGTPVESIDRWHESFKKGLMLMKTIIDICVNNADVDFYTVLGNHSSEREYYLAKALEAFYDKNKNVNIITTPSSRSYLEIGNSAFMLTHEVNNRIVKNLPVIFVTEQSQLYAKSKYRYVLTGHLHKTSETHFMSTNEEYGLVFKIMPSLCNTDKWHYDNFFIGNQKSCIGLIIHDDYGLISEIIYNE